MLGNEFYKILSKKKLWIIFIICIILKILFSIQMETVMFDGFNSKVYRYYIDKLEGTYTTEKHEWIAEEYGRLEKLINDEDIYEEQYKKNEIDAKEFKSLSDDIKSAKNRIATVEYLLEKSEYYAGLNGQAEYFYDIEVADYLENMDVDIFLIAVMIVIITLIFTDDYYCGTVYLVKSSEYGTKKLFHMKLICTLIISVFCGVLFPCIEFLTKYKVFDLGNLNAGIQSLACMKDSNLSLSILHYIGLTIITRMFYAVIMGIIIMYIAQVSHQNIVTYVVILAFVYIPEFVYHFVDRLIQDISLCQGLGAYEGYCNYHEFIGLPNMLVSMMVYAVLGIIMVNLGGRNFCSRIR